MPDLSHSLLKQDIGHLRIIAEFWGLELESVDVDSAREELSASLLDFELLNELMDSLSPQADLAITDLVNSGGKITWQAFTRKYGDIREMGQSWMRIRRASWGACRQHRALRIRKATAFAM